MASCRNDADRQGGTARWPIDGAGNREANSKRGWIQRAKQGSNRRGSSRCCLPGGSRTLCLDSFEIGGVARRAVVASPYSRRLDSAGGHAIGVLACPQNRNSQVESVIATVENAPAPTHQRHDEQSGDCRSGDDSQASPGYAWFAHLRLRCVVAGLHHGRSGDCAIPNSTARLYRSTGPGAGRSIAANLARIRLR